jgi:hypothetical protein
MDQGVSASHACGHAGSSGVKWPHDTPGAPAAGEKRPYPDGSKYIQPQLAHAGAIDVTSRAAPRPTGGPITQRETQRPADGFPNADYERLAVGSCRQVAIMQIIPNLYASTAQQGLICPELSGQRICG